MEPDGDLLAGRYELGPLVGLGGTAQVYRAWDHHDGRAVAVKIFRPGSAPCPGDGGARELEVLDRVAHPGVVALHDSGVDPQGCPFVVMDYVDGQSLAQRLQDGPLPPATVARLGVVLADALKVVHARGVVHRDVKPANVLLDADGRPWLTDFGIARIVDATRVTATGLVVGTAAYMAPEQVRGEPVGPPADVYALGLVLLEAVTGRREYEGNALESALARLHRVPGVPAEVPDPLAATLRRMTAPDPAERPPAAVVATVLRTPPLAETVAPRRPAARRAAPVAALASLVAAALAGALTLTGMQSSADPGAVVAAAPPVVPPLVTPTPQEADSPTTVLAVPTDPSPVPVAVTSRRATPAAERSAPTRPSSTGTRDDGTADDRSSGDDGDRRTRDDNQGNDDQGNDHASTAHDNAGNDGAKSGDGGDSGKGGKGHGGDDEKKDSGKKDGGKDGGGKGGGGKGGDDRSTSNSGKD